MRKIRVLATIIIFCLMLGQIPDAFLQTVYAQNSTLLNVGGFKIYNSENNVMGGEVTSGQEMKQGQAIIITFDWDVNNAATSGSFTGTINLQEMAENIKVGTVTSQPLVDANGNPVDGATFSINQNGELTININDLSQASNRLGKAKINAVVNVGNSDDEREALSGEEVNIKIDDASATVVFTNNGEESYFDVSKEAVGKASKVGTDLIQPFKIKLKARNNKVYFEDNDYIADVVSANTELSLVENSLVVTSNNNSLAGTYQNFETLTAKLKEIGTIDGATTIEIAYDMKVSNNAVDIYSQEYESNKDAFKNTVDVKYHDNKGNQEQNSWTSAYADVNRASVAKSGTYNAEQESVEWTISIHLGDIDDGTKTLSEMVTSLKDIPANGQFDLTGNNNFNAGQWDMTSLLNSFTKNGEGVYTYTFSLPVSDSVKETTGQTDLLNNVEMEVNGHTYSTQGKVTFGGRNWLGKNAGTYDAENKQIYWDVALTDIPEGVSEVTLTDEIPTWDLAAGNDNHTLGNSDIVLMAENSSPVSLVTYTGNNATLNSELVASYEVDASGKQMVLKLKDAFVTNYKQRDVIIRYATTVGDSVVAERIYRNGIKLDYKENGVSATQRRADSSIRMTNPIKKECEYSNANNFTANYKLSADLTAIPELLALDLGTFNWGVIESANETVIITDTLPLNMKLKEISSIYTDGDWGAYQDNYTPYYSYTTQTVTKADGEHQQVVLTFTLTKQLIKDMQDKATAGKSLNLVVNYVTEVDDKAAFTEAGVEQEFVNTAEFSYNNISRGSIDESIKMTPIDAVRKEYSYTPEEAPYVYYTITVNPGAVDFVENSDWLQAVDTLSSGLKYHDFKDTSLDGKRALKVEKKVGNTWVTLTQGSTLAANDGDYAYEIGKDASNNDQCTFRLPDATSLRITYVARMILPQGTVLTAVNSSNTFELTATSGDKTTDKIDMTASGTSYGSSVSVESDTGSITIYKYYEDANGTNQPVPNTTFQIKLCEWDATNKVLKEKEIFTADTTNVVGSEHLITVGANGKITVNRLLLDNIYALYEITPGSQDVVKEDKPYYFILQGNESLEFPDEFTETRKVLFAKGAQAPQLDFENQLKPVPEKGKLILTKELKGDITAEEAENIDFTVTCENTGSTYSETINVKDDFTYANGVYTLEIGDLAPGTYTVQEVTTAPSGKTLSMSYSVNGGVAVTGNATVQAVVVSNQETTVAYENTYTDIVVVPEKGMLILTKELKGDITAEEAENIDFTVTCENTGSTYSETFNVKDDFTYANGVYTLEIGELEPGTYTVQEVTTAPSGKTLSMSYSVNGGVAVTGNATVQAVVVSNQETTVAYENTYTDIVVVPEKGRIILTKTIVGDVTKEEAKAALQFVVKNNLTLRETVYTLTDFVYNDSAQIYVLELAEEVGNYTIIEKATDIAGYEKAIVTYSLDGAAAQTGEHVEIALAKDEVHTVAFTNTYEKPEPKPEPNPEPEPTPEPTPEPDADEDDEDEDEDDEDDESEENTVTEQTYDSIPKTGDDSHLVAYYIAFVLSVLGMMGLLIGRAMIPMKREEHEE